MNFPEENNICSMTKTELVYYVDGKLSGNIRREDSSSLALPSWSLSCFAFCEGRPFVLMNFLLGSSIRTVPSSNELF